MSTELLPRPFRYLLAAIGSALILLTLVGRSLTSVQAARQSLTPHGDSAAVTAGHTYVVNSTDDLPDADVGDPNSICAAANGKCTLRAAIMQANYVTGLDTILRRPNTTFPATTPAC